MKSNILDVERADENEDRGLIVKRIELNFNNKECQVLNFTDMTAYQRLKKEEETSNLLKTLNYSVHHEMLGPLKTCVEISDHLQKKLPNQHEKRMVQTMLVASQLVLFHANDLLDQRIIQNGSFTPDYQEGDICMAIMEIVNMVRWTLERKQI